MFTAAKFNSVKCGIADITGFGGVLCGFVNHLESAVRKHHAQNLLSEPKEKLTCFAKQ
jgi:hypothetical protein